MLRNYLVMGDLTGSRAKIAILGWTMKPRGCFSTSTLLLARGLVFSWQSNPQFLARGVCLACETDELAARRLVLLALVDCHDHGFYRPTFPAMEEQDLTAAAHRIPVVPSSSCFCFVLGRDFVAFRFPKMREPLPGTPILCFGTHYLWRSAAFCSDVCRWDGISAEADPKVVTGCPVLAFLLLFITITEFQVRRAVFSSPYNFFALRTWQQEH